MTHSLMQMGGFIKQIILISGKRKSGKDFLSERLLKSLGTSAEIVRISAPIKIEWAKKLNLDLEDLLSDGPYKEKYRKDMIAWSDKVRAEDYGYFCRKAMQNVSSDIVIVSDIRRRNDIKYFYDTYGICVKTIRINCKESVRAERGWINTCGVDDVQSECDLDSYTEWDLVLENNNQMSGDALVESILKKFFFI